MTLSLLQPSLINASWNLLFDAGSDFADFVIGRSRLDDGPIIRRSFDPALVLNLFRHDGVQAKQILSWIVKVLWN